MFKWVCFGAAAGFGIVTLVFIYQLKTEVTSALASAESAVEDANQAVTTVNDQLPEIIAQVKTGTETLSQLAEDVELIKSVAGVSDGTSDKGIRGLATYADEMQQMLRDRTQGAGATILIQEIFGKDLKEVESIEEFLVGLNKEMFGIILPLAKSRQEILYRATHSRPPRRQPFHIRLPGQEPQRLDDFIRRHHAASASLPAYRGGSKAEISGD